MIAELTQQLLDVLVGEERVHRELRQLLAGERECMLSMDIEGLYERAARKQALADEGRITESARIQAANRLARELSVPGEPVTLTRLCTALDANGPGQGDALRDAQSRLLALVSATRELAEANQILGGERLMSVQTTLRLLGKLTPTDETGSGQLVRTNA